MDNWKTVFREGIAPQLGRRHLEALREALEKDSPEVCQQMTTDPGPLPFYLTSPVVCACPLAYAGWKGEGLATVGDVHRWFNEVCQGVWRLLAGSHLDHTIFTNWVDDYPRDTVRLQLLAEVTAEMRRRDEHEQV